MLNAAYSARCERAGSSQLIRNPPNDPQRNSRRRTGRSSGRCCRRRTGGPAAAAPVPDHAAAHRPGRIAPAEADRIYYGRLLAQALAETGRIANDNGDDTVTLYEADLIRNQGGVQSWGWNRNTVRGSLRPVPANMLPHFRPANRGQFFPANIRYQPLS